MSTIETTGKSLDEAKNAAAKQLGVEAGQLQVEVLEQSKGLFGKSNVRIRATATATAAVVAEEPAAKAEEAPAKPARAPRGGRTTKAKAPDPEPEPEPEAEAAAPAPTRAPARAKAPAAATNGEQGEEHERRDAEATKEDGEAMLELVNEMMREANFDVKARVGSLSGRYVNIELNGKDVTHLIARSGEGLNGLQSLVNIIWNHRSPNGIRATLDGDEYRLERERVLETMARQVAEQVKERGEEAVLRPLPAFERRIIHKVLSEIEGIVTYSEGEDPERRVVIAPAE